MGFWPPDDEDAKIMGKRHVKKGRNEQKKRREKERNVEKKRGKKGKKKRVDS